MTDPASALLTVSAEAYGVAGAPDLTGQYEQVTPVYWSHGPSNVDAFPRAAPISSYVAISRGNAALTHRYKRGDGIGPLWIGSHCWRCASQT
jgi:hypothetical protein